MAKFRTMVVLYAVLVLTAPALCLPGQAAEEMNVDRVEDLWHPIESLAAPDGISAKLSEADEKEIAADPYDEDNDRIQGRSVSGDTSEDSDKDLDEDEDDVSEKASRSAWLNGDYYYDYDYPIDEEFDTVNDTKPEENQESQSSTVLRAKRHSPQLAEEWPISLRKRTLDGVVELDHNNRRKQSPTKSETEKKEWSPENVPTGKEEKQRRRSFPTQFIQRQEQPSRRIIIRQRLQPGPNTAADSSQLGYRLQALLGGRASATSSAYSPSQQPSKQISATFNQRSGRTFSGFQRDSTKSDAAKVLYTLAFLSKFPAQQKGSKSQSAVYGGGYTLGSSASSYRPFKTQAGSGGVTQLSEIRSRPAKAPARKIAIVRLLQPLIRLVTVQKDNSPNNFQNFIEKLSSQESSAGYQTLIRQIQAENLKQHRFRQRLVFWRRLAQKLRQSQEDLPCNSK